MKVGIITHNDEMHIHIGTGHFSQETVFSKGDILRKVSENHYFNSGEIIHCVGLVDKVAYFTSERLKEIHEKRHQNGENQIAGIPLEKGETFLFVTNEELRNEVINKRIKSLKNKIIDMERKVKSNDHKIAKLNNENSELISSIEFAKKSIKENQDLIK